ncbi:MAG TPA: transglycosylase family protein [Solirubrobacterales bacterium]|nr:transglycosylase family protein [Solirubrobacterales bacterium]
MAQKKEADKFGDLPGSVTLATLNAIADCESGGDPEIVSSSGLYYGKYQFSPGTWESVGGKGLPSEASEAEQDYRAALLYTRSGPGQWPVCGQ